MRAGRGAGAIAAVLAICVGLLLAVLTTLAASDVVNAPAYIFMNTVLAVKGLCVRVFDAATGQSAEDVRVPRPSRFKLAWYAAIALMGLRRSNVGGFGATIPEQTAHSGGFG